MRKERERREGRIGVEIVIGGIALLLVLGCNNGIAELEKKNQFLSSIVSLGNEFLNVFTSFGEMAGSALGFKTDPKKSDVRDYFDKVHDKVERTKTAISKIVSDMKEKGNPNAEATDAAVKKLINEKLEIIIQGAKKARDAIGSDAKEAIGNVAAGSAAGFAGSKVDELVEGIKGIVKVVLKDNEGKPEAGTAKKADALSGDRGNTAQDGEAGKLFVTSGDAGANVKKAAADAAKAVGAVTGADILQAIKSDGDAVKLAQSTDGNVTKAPKDATIAGGIALRAMAKNGKFANNSAGGSDVVTSVADTATSAVTKALDTLTIAIRKTIDEGLKTVKEAMKISANDNSETAAAK